MIDLSLWLRLGLFCLSLAAASHGLGVMSVDYGTEWLKVALVKPGIPLEVVLNKDSKRKTDAVVTILEGVRYFGSDAVSLGLKRPHMSYGKLKNLLGRSFTDPLAQQYRQLYDNTMTNHPTRASCAFQHEDAHFAVEELVAMQLAQARKDAEVFAGSRVTEAVITVPPFYTHAERQALLDAARIADINVISLINDETAVALNYAMSRQFDDQPQYHVFYDMGAGSTVASLVEFRSLRDADAKKYSTAKNFTQIEVKAVGYDRTLGGLEVDVRLQQFLAREFNAKYGKKLNVDVFSNQRAMARLLREANRIKHILSANMEVTASVESLVNEVDLRVKVTREDLIRLLDDLFGRLGGPIDAILSATNLTLADVQSFVIVGGGIRIPALQEKLQEYVGSDKIAKHVNQDEAAVLGAALQGAVLSPQFKTKDLRIKDVAVHPVVISYPSAGDSGRMIAQKIFHETSPIGVKKKITFKHQQDFNFTLRYDTKTIEARDQYFGPSEILSVSVVGIQEAIAKYNVRNASESKLKLVIGLSESGLLTLDDAIAEFVVKEEENSGSAGIVDSVMSFFGGSGDSKARADAVDNSTETVSVDSEVDSPSANNETEEKTIQVKTKIETVKLILVTQSAFNNMTVDDLQAANDRMKAMDEEDRLRRERDEARNSLEAFVYNTMDALDRPAIESCSTEQERDNLRTKLSEMSEWLYNEGEWSTTGTEAYRTRLRALKSSYDPISNRVDEMKNRPSAIQTFQATLKELSTFAVDAEKNDTTIGYYYPEAEIHRFQRSIEEWRQWLIEKNESQSKLGPKDAPVLVVADLEEMVAKMKRELILLKTRRKYVVKETPTPTSTLIPTPDATTILAESQTPVPEAEKLETRQETTDQATEGIPTPKPVDHDEL